MVLKVRGDNKPSAELKDDDKVVESQAAKPNTTMQEDLANTDGVDNNGQEGGDDNNDDGEGALIDGASGNVIDNASDDTSNMETGTADAGAGAEPQTGAEAASDPVVETQAAAEEPAPKTEPAKALATKSTSTGVAIAPTGGDKVALFLEELAAEGQAGLTMGYGVFPVLNLDKGEFKINDEDIGSDPFAGVALQSMPKFAYRTTGLPDKDSDVIFADTDTEHENADSAVSAKILEWKEKFPSAGWEIKTYQNIVFYVSSMPSKPMYEGQIIILSVAPTSIRRYTGVCLTVKSKGYKMHEAVIQVSRGEKVRGEFEYYPWHFAPLGSCRKLGVEIKFGTVVDENF